MKKIIVFCVLTLMMSGCSSPKLLELKYEIEKKVLEEVQTAKTVSGLDKAEKLSMIYRNINGKNIFPYGIWNRI